eukprot:s445_g11.t2
MAGHDRRALSRLLRDTLDATWPVLFFGPPPLPVEHEEKHNACGSTVTPYSRLGSICFWAEDFICGIQSWDSLPAALAGSADGLEDSGSLEGCPLRVQSASLIHLYLFALLPKGNCCFRKALCDKARACYRVPIGAARASYGVWVKAHKAVSLETHLRPSKRSRPKCAKWEQTVTKSSIAFGAVHEDGLLDPSISCGFWKVVTLAV